MELMVTYQEMGYSIEVYFPEADAPDTWTIWVVKDGHMVGEFRKTIVVSSVYGMDQATMVALEAAAEAAVTVVIGRELCAQFDIRPISVQG